MVTKYGISVTGIKKPYRTTETSEDTVTSVSYTHLDVYKRQDLLLIGMRLTTGVGGGGEMRLG